MKDNITMALIHRYKDAYLHAKAIVGFGAAIKILAIVLAIVIAIAGANAGGESFLFFSIVVGFTVGAIVYFTGVNIAAQGQILQATLDSAVNSSPLLDNEQKARVMSLPLEPGRSVAPTAPRFDGSEIGVGSKQAPRIEAGNQSSFNSVRCELCGRQFPSRYYFVNHGEASRLLCLECEKKLSDDQIVDFMQGGSPELPT